VVTTALTADYFCNVTVAYRDCLLNIRIYECPSHVTFSDEVGNLLMAIVNDAVDIPQFYVPTGGWTPWTSYTPCTRACGGGKQWQ